MSPSPLNQRKKKSPTSNQIFQHFYRRQRNFIALTGGVTFVLLFLHYVSLEQKQKSYVLQHEQQKSSSSLRGAENMEKELLLYKDGMEANMYANGSTGAIGTDRYVTENEESEIKKAAALDSVGSMDSGYTLDTLSHIMMDKLEDKGEFDVEEEEQLTDDMTLPTETLQSNTDTAVVENSDASQMSPSPGIEAMISRNKLIQQKEQAYLEDNDPTTANAQIIEGTVPMKYYLNQKNGQFTVVDLPYLHCSPTTPEESTGHMILLKGSNEYTSSSTWNDSGILSKLCQGSSQNVPIKVTAIDLNVDADGQQLYSAYEALTHGRIVNEKNGVVWVTPNQSGNAILDVAQQYQHNQQGVFSENNNNIVKAWIMIGTNAQVLQTDPTTLQAFFLHRSIPILSIINTEEKVMQLGIQDKLVALQYAGSEIAEMSVEEGNGRNEAFFVHDSEEFVKIVLGFLERRVFK